MAARAWVVVVVVMAAGPECNRIRAETHSRCTVWRRRGARRTRTIQVHTPGYVGHPKIAKLVEIVEEHFRTHESPLTTRVMVFSHYRDSVEEIVRHMSHTSTVIKPMAFVGQVRSPARLDRLQRAIHRPSGR